MWWKTSLQKSSPAFLTFLAFTVISLLSNPLKAEPGKPNIVFIFADDLGWQDTGFSGSDFAETPHLDRLAKEGMVFRHAYSAAGNCAPSRACLISGQYTPRHHVYAVGSTNRGPAELMRMQPVPNKLTLPAETVTLAEAMKAAGYATGMFGKCHLKSANGSKSEQAGFDVVNVSQHGLNSKEPDDPKGIFSITTAACEFIEKTKIGHSSPTFRIMQFIRGFKRGRALSTVFRKSSPAKPTMTRCLRLHCRAG
jgi:hypothetical protein